MPYPSKIKVFVSGKHVEVYESEMPVWRDYESNKSQEKQAKPMTKEEMLEDKKRKINYSVNRAKFRIKRLVNANPQLNKFLTLTFAENLTDLSKTNPMFHNFIKRVKHKYKNFQYLAVPEFQKRGAVHYHLFCNLPYVDVKKFSRIWDHGYIDLKRIDDVSDMGLYMCKYLSKEMFNERTSGKKKFFRSVDLRQPIELDGELAMKYAENIRNTRQPVYKNQYKSEYLGLIKVEEYKLDFAPDRIYHLRKA